MNRFLLKFLFLSMVALVGCNGNSPKQSYASVSGTVTFNGAPLEKGTITFSIPGFPPTSTEIIDGKFAGQAMVGTNTISISAKKKGKGFALRGDAARDAETQRKGYLKKFEEEGTPIDHDPTLVEIIPEEWNTKSQQKRIVEAGVDNKFEFIIKGN
jgi:hypothetical protein